MIRAGQTAAQDESAFQLINPAEWEGFRLALAENAPEVLTAALQVLKTQAERNRFILFLGAGVAIGAIVEGVVSELSHTPPKLKFTGGEIGDADSEAPDEDPEQEPEPDPSTTATACDPEATRNKDSVSQSVRTALPVTSFVK